MPLHPGAQVWPQERVGIHEGLELGLGPNFRVLVYSYVNFVCESVPIYMDICACDALFLPSCLCCLLCGPLDCVSVFG